MNMNELCPNLVFVGEGAKEFGELELTDEQVKSSLKAKELGAKAGARIRRIVEEERKENM